MKGKGREDIIKGNVVVVRLPGGGSLHAASGEKHRQNNIRLKIKMLAGWGGGGALAGRGQRFTIVV